MQARAYAKINFCLDVTGKRADGYHDLITVMQTVDLYDQLTFQVRNSDRKRIVITSNLDSLPVDKNNLVYRAADLFMGLTGLCLEGSIHIEKNIPVAAGLGGGSSDAGCTLRVLNQLTGNRIDLETLSAESKAIGADVPFSVYGGTALVTGIGEHVKPFCLKDDLWLVLVCPNISVSTKSVFQKYVLDQNDDRKKTRQVVNALEQGDVRLLGLNLFNKLESVTIKDYPEIGEIKKMLVDTGAWGAVMSGSGPTVLGLYPKPEEARAAQEYIADQLKESCRTLCVKTIKRSDYE